MPADEPKASPEETEKALSSLSAFVVEAMRFVKNTKARGSKWAIPSRVLRNEVRRLAIVCRRQQGVVDQARMEMSGHNEHCDCDMCAAFYALDYIGRED